MNKFVIALTMCSFTSFLFQSCSGFPLYSVALSPIHKQIPPTLRFDSNIISAVKGALYKNYRENKYFHPLLSKFHSENAEQRTTVKESGNRNAKRLYVMCVGPFCISTETNWFPRSFYKEIVPSRLGNGEIPQP